MGRPRRVDIAGYAYHVLNRSVGRRLIFEHDRDFAAFERVMAEAVEWVGGDVELLAYCIMGNHWHLVLRTCEDGAMGRFMKWLTLTHTQRYRTARGTVGDGPVYRGRYKSFIIEQDRHLLTVCRYVERNAARAGLVDRAEQWPWSSLRRSRHGEQGAGGEPEDPPLVLSPWPVPGGRPSHWLRTVNTPLSEQERNAIRQSIDRHRPYGSDHWVQRQIDQLRLASTMRPRGRPRSNPKP